MSSSGLHLLACLLIFSLLGVHSHRKDPPPPPCSNYEMLIVNTRHCVRRCPIHCVQGNCYESNDCPCEGSYVTSFAKGLICARRCFEGCVEAGGHCAAPDLCLCRRKGDIFDAVARRCRPVTRFHDRCLGRCLYGRCSSTGECVCAQGYRRATGLSLLGQMCEPICKQDCGRRGFCYLPDMCACRRKHEHYEYDGKCHHDIQYF